MTGEAFEYAIRKDIRNNPIVREVDRDRQREMRLTLGLVAFLIGVLMFWTWQQFELLRHGYRVEDLQRQRAEALEVSRQLKLEIETLRSPIRIERLALEQLRMNAPGPEDAAVIERVTPPPAPPQSAVARR